MCKPDILAGVVTTNTGATALGSPLEFTADQVLSSASEAVLEGDVRVRQGDQRLQAPLVTLDRLANRVQASDNVVYGDPKLAVRSRQADLDLNNESGQFKDAEYYLPSRNAQGKAAQVRIDRRSQQSHLENVTYSTCARGDEFWQLRARQMDLDETTGRGSARHMTLAIKDVPIMYLPYLSFPITDERQSGLLAPSFGLETGNGFDARIPYYWNIAPNRDMTITPRIMTKRGLLLGEEYRFLNPGDRGEIRLEYIPYDQEYGGARGAADIKYNANPLPNLYTNLLYEHVSDDTYIRDFSNNLGLFNPTYLEQHLAASYSGDSWTTFVQAQTFQTIDPLLFGNNEPYSRLPQLLFTGAWPQRFSGLDYKLRGELVRFERDSGITGNRLDLYPGISLPMEWPAGFITPRLSYRYTTYDLQATAPGVNNSPSRSAPVVSMDSGLFFERPVQWTWWGKQADIQTLEPRLFYLYVPYRNQTDIPVFDSAEVNPGYPWLFTENRFVGADRLGDANQLTTAFTTRLLNASDGSERLRASIGRIHYFSTPRVSLEYFSTPGVSLEDTVPNEVLAPGLIAEGRLYLRSDLLLHGALEWDERFGNTRRSVLDLRYDSGDGRLFNFSYRLVENALEQLDAATVWPLNAQWRTVARWNYSLQDSRNMDVMGGFEYGDCCWALRMLARQRRDQPTDPDVKNAVYVELELRGLAGVGTKINKMLEQAILGYEPTRY